MEFLNGSSVALANPINLTCGDIKCNDMECANMELDNITTDSITINNPLLPGYIPTALNVYEEFNTSATSTGCLARLCNFSFMRIGRHVTLSFEGFNTSPQVCTGNGTLDFLAFIPARFRPDIDENAIIRVNFNGSIQAGSSIIIGSSGDFRIFPAVAGGSWSTSQLINVSGFSMAYTVP